MENDPGNVQVEPKGSISPPRIPDTLISRTTVCYEKQTVEELLGLLLGALEKSEHECTYWSTMYEESQKELFSLRERMRKEDEAEYIDPEVIPARRSSKPSLEGGDAPMDGEEEGGPRWFSLKAAVKSAMSAVVGGSAGGSASNSQPNYTSLT